MIILIDQDGPLADFENGFIKIWRKTYPNEFYVPFNKRNTFQVRDQYPKHLVEYVDKIQRSKGFYLHLPIVSGCVGAIKEMEELGHEIRICTSPLPNYEHCVLEKYLWIEKYFGREFTKRIILTTDKTLIKGDILIDDKPEINGSTASVWEHVIYEYPYNIEVINKRKINWLNWKEILRT